MGNAHGVDRIVYGGMTMEREPVHDDDTVVRARPGTGPTGSVAPDVRPTGSGPAADPSEVLDEDPYGATVIRPARGVQSVTGPAEDDTVLRVRPDGAGPAAASERASPAATPPRSDDGSVRRRTPSVRIGGRVVRLDRPLVVGRRPAAPRVVLDDGPVLVPVPSPSGQVSSSHVLLHAAGEAAVVEDLRSTNGTVVRPPGGAPFRMAAGASIVVLTGTLVEIGDGNVIEVLSPHLRVGPDDGLPPFPPAP